MSWKITPGWSPADADAAAYITAVETADNQALENGVKVAIDNFVIGCKADGIWSAIKASCILAGARTLAGALVPLVGAAPTNVGGNFVAGDYNRKTGLLGDGSTKHLNSNRNNNADPQNSFHLSVYVSSSNAGTGNIANTNGFPLFIGTGFGTGGCNLNRDQTTNLGTRNRAGSYQVITLGNSTGLIGTNRSQSSAYIVRRAGLNVQITVTSETPLNGAIGVFRAGAAETAYTYSNARLAFYSIGESLNLALLDARVTTLVNAFDAAI
jgi:hypothetical protein